MTTEVVEQLTKRGKKKFPLELLSLSYFTMSTTSPAVQRNKRVSLSVPGTTANLGPMFDIAGIALSCAIHVQVEVSTSGKQELIISGLGSDSADVKDPATNMVVVGAEQMLDELGVPKGPESRPPLKWTMHSDVPTKAGLGSSSAAVVAGMVAANALCGLPLDLDKMLQLAGRIEGHPDNAAPAIMGGMVLVFKDAEGIIRVVRVPVSPSLRFVAFTPTAVMKKSTTVNRGQVPKQFAISDVIHNMARTSVLLTALITGTTTLLEHCSEEKIHQNYRAPDYPHFHVCLKAAIEAGSNHTFMSGSGPSVGALVMPSGADDTKDFDAVSKKIADAMEAAAKGAGVEGVSRILRVCPTPIAVKVEDVAAAAPAGADEAEKK